MAGKTDAQVKLGKAIREARKQLGYSQEEFAHECGLHRTYIGVIERGEKNVALNNIVRISEALEMRVTDLFENARL